MPTREAPGLDASGQAPIFAALGDEMRLRIVLRLVDEGPQSITRLTEGTAVTRQAITKHLVVLENAGIVRGKTRGREHLWEVEVAGLAEARHWLDVISQQWDERLNRLRALVEE
jgi:DNA-binding transcriptional ArsR family regulator